MGIKGIYSEIGPGERIALSKLAIETLEEKRRPLRIAIDVSIWQFQMQSGRGGSNPAIRTLYYRLLRLISLSVQPLFVFDGPHKPPFKRNKKTGQHGAAIPNLLMKQLLNLFCFPFHIAPGEAEAECALLQINGVVDAVLSEDVDTLMFGCGVTLRNWSSEGSRGNKAPTHVSVYDAHTTKLGKSGLDREGMVLIALMSGGDYITEGIPGCGIKVACEAARAGYGERLCEISRTDKASLVAWRSNLAHELQTNESHYFRVKHKSLKIPEDFPNQEVLGYYTHPIVSSKSKLRKLKDEIVWDGELDIYGLRVFVAEAFDWSHKSGGRKFIRGLAPALLVHKLRLRADRRDSDYGDIVLTSCNELELVRTICGQRTHFSSDGLPEIRVIYCPLDIVGINLDDEEDGEGDYGRDGLAAMDGDDYAEASISSEPQATAQLASPNKRAASVYDPSQPDKLWIPQTIAKLGIPLKVEDYEESLRNPRKFIKQKAAVKRAATKGGMPKGALDRYITTSKPVSVSKSVIRPSSQKTVASSQPTSPPAYLAPGLERLVSSQKSFASAKEKSSVIDEPSASTSSANKVSTRTATTRKQREHKTAYGSFQKTTPWTWSRTDSAANSVLNVTKPLFQTVKSSRPQSSNSDKYLSIDPVSSSSIRPLSPLPATKPTKVMKELRLLRSNSLKDIGHESAELELPPLPSGFSKTRKRDTMKENPPMCLEENVPSDEPQPNDESVPLYFSNVVMVSELSGLNMNGIECVVQSLDPDQDLTTMELPPQTATSPLNTSNYTSNLHLLSPPSSLNNPILLTSSPPPPSTPPSCNKSRVITSPRVEKPANDNKQALRRKKQVFILRESIGAWEQMGEDEVSGKQKPGSKKMKGRRVVRESQVEFLDLRDGE